MPALEHGAAEHPQATHPCTGLPSTAPTLLFLKIPCKIPRMQSHKLTLPTLQHHYVAAVHYRAAWIDLPEKKKEKATTNGQHYITWQSSSSARQPSY